MDYTVYSQKLDLDVDFLSQSLRGSTTIQLQAKSKEIQQIRLNARQCKIRSVTVKKLNIQTEGRSKPVKAQWGRSVDPFESLGARWSQGARQHHFMRWRAEDRIRLPPDEPEDALVIQIPDSNRDDEFETSRRTLPWSNAATNGISGTDTSETTAKYADGIALNMLELVIEYDVPHFRDGLHFVGLQPNDERYPHVYTRNSIFPGSASCIFPCVDSQTTLLSWDISIKYPRTLGDALRLPKPPASLAGSSGNPVNGLSKDGHLSEPEFAVPLSEEERILEMCVVCSGNVSDDIIDPNDPTRKTATFRLDQAVAARHIGFAIGPFEYVNLSDFRESDQDEKFGDNAVRVHGFCLPGRGEEVKNTCMPLAAALDDLRNDYGSYPFPSHKVCFVDDLSSDVLDTASLSLCSNRLLVPEDILDPLFHSTRELLRGVTAQWIGISIVPRAPEDLWIVIGAAYFMADHFGKKLWGRNEHQFRTKTAADDVFKLDVQMPSLIELGAHIEIPEWQRFMNLKAPVVLEILHNRLVKASGRNGVNRILNKALQTAKAAETLSEGTISTQGFMKLCEKVGHTKVDKFFAQWVQGSGCPDFFIKQNFNKKKLVVELDIRQTQSEEIRTDGLDPSNFQQKFKEHQLEVSHGQIQPVFQGPMTIRIHEADGTPYEHIVEIKEKNTRIEIPYNTKYKRLKKGRRDKERAAANVGRDIQGEDQDDVLLYCLGDTLQSQEEVNDWRLADWTEIEDKAMQNESYEWIRIDKDFEWIARIQLNQPPYMFVSQLQQDNDVIAQMEALNFFDRRSKSALMSTVCVRTLMDHRYFHGIRTMAADILAKCAKENLQWIGLHHLQKAFEELYCFPGSPMTRANDFSDRASYVVQCAIPRAMAKIHDEFSQVRVPDQVKHFFLDKLKFNENTNNEYSDSYYVSTLLTCLADVLIAEGQNHTHNASFEDINFAEVDFLKTAVNEIDRYRRIDEWLPSFQNIHTVTAMDCMQRLMQNRIIPLKAKDVLHYTRPGNADPIREKAFEGLAELRLMANPAVLSYVVQSFAFEPSPYMREKIWKAFWLGLGHLALSKGRDLSPAPAQNGDLVIEQASASQHPKGQSRGITAILQTIKGRLGNHAGLEAAFSEALTSPALPPLDFFNLLELCDVLYDEVDKLVLRLDLPRIWHVEHVGGARVRFFHSKGDRVRTRKMPEETKQWWKKNLPKPQTNGIARPETVPASKRRRESTIEDQVGQPHPHERVSQKTMLTFKSKIAPPQQLERPKASAARLQSLQPPIQTRAPSSQPQSQSKRSPSVQPPLSRQQSTKSLSASQQPVQPPARKPSKIVKLKLKQHHLAKATSPSRTTTNTQVLRPASPPPDAAIKSEASSPEVAMAHLDDVPRTHSQAPMPASAPVPATSPPLAQQSSAPKFKLKLNMKK